MERQDRLLPTPMPPEEKQVLRAKAKQDIARGFGLLGTDILGSAGDIGGLISKFLPVAGGQSMDDLYAGTKKPSQVLEEGIGSIAFQKAFNINPTGSFGENLSRFGGSAIPLSASGIVNTLKAPKKIAGALRQSMVTPDGVVLKMDDVPRTNAEVLMSEASGKGGMKPKPEMIDINKKNRDTDEITFGSALSTDKSIYSRLIYDLENINKRGGMSIPNDGISPQEAINILKGRATALEAQESGLLAYLQRRVDTGDETLITRDKMLEIARAYKPNINKRTYSLKEKQQLRKDTSWADNMKSEDAAKIVEDYEIGILNAKEQLPYNIDLVATDYKITHFNDITEVNPADKLRKDSFMGTKIKGLDSELLPQGYHDYGETDLNPGYFGHIRNADVKLDPNLNDGLSDGVIAIEHQMNLAGNKDLNQSLKTLPGRIDPQKEVVAKLKQEAAALDMMVNKTIEFAQKKLGRKLNMEELKGLSKYKNSPEFKLDGQRLSLLKDKIAKEENTLTRMQGQLRKGTDKSDSFGIAAAKRREEIAEGKETEELIPEYKAENNEKFLNVLTNEDRVLIDEIAKIDVKEGVGLSTFRTNKKKLRDDIKKLGTEVEDLNIQLSQYDDLKDSIAAQGLAGENAVGVLKQKSKIKPDIPVSPFTIYDSRGDLAIDPFFEMFVDAKKLGVNENFKIKLARNQIDDKINNIIDYEKKTASMDLGFFQKVKKELKGETTRRDNKNIVDNVMKSEANNYYETQKLTTEFVEKIRSNPKFYENFDEDTITNLKARLNAAEEGGIYTFGLRSDEVKKAKFDLNIAITEAIENSGINLNKMATELVENSIKDTRQIPAFSPQMSKNPAAHKKQAILDLVESITKPTTVKVPGSVQKTNNGRPVINRQGPVMENIDFDGSINSIDNLNILKARLGKNAYAEEIAFLEDKVKQGDKKINDLFKKEDVEFGKAKFLKLSQELRKKLTDKKLQDVFLRAMKHEADEMNVPITPKPLFKNAPFPNLKKAGQFLARSNIEQAIEDGKQFIAFPSRRDYAIVRQRSGPGEFEAVFGKNLDNVLKEYAKKGAILKNQTISGTDGTISNTIARDPMRVLDLRPLLGKKKEAIPRMAMGGLFEKFRKAG